MTTTPPSEEKPNRKIRCLIIQLARLGDSVQSLMALRAAKQLYPGLEVEMVVRETFSDAVKRTPWIAKTHSLPTDEILRPILEGKSTEREGMQSLARFLAPLVAERWDYVLNWTFSESSSHLTSLIPAKVKLGFGRNAESTLTCLDGWTHYMQAIIQGKVRQNIHVTDLLTTQLLTALQIHEGEPTSQGTSAPKRFFELNLTRSALPELMQSQTKWIGIQLGASHKAESWPVEEWKQLISKILTRHSDYGIMIFGSKKETPLLQDLFGNADFKPEDFSRILPLVGQSHFDEWAYAISRCHWLISADTAAIHLASTVGTRVLNISFGDSRFEETGPYGSGHLIVARTDGDTPTSDAVYGIWSLHHSDWSRDRNRTVETHFSELGFTNDLSTLIAKKSRVRSPDDGGGVTYESLNKGSVSTADWCSRVMGDIARTWYCGWVPPVGQGLAREELSPDILRTLRETIPLAEEVEKDYARAQYVAQQIAIKSGKQKSDRLMGIEAKQELGALGQELCELEASVKMKSATNTLLDGFQKMHTVMMHNLKGTHLKDIANESAASFTQLVEGIRILKTWAKHTLELSRPRKISENATPQTSLKVVE